MFDTCVLLTSFFFFFFNDTATTEIYTLSLHDALPIDVPRAPDATRRESVVLSRTVTWPPPHGGRGRHRAAASDRRQGRSWWAGPTRGGRCCSLERWR